MVRYTYISYILCLCLIGISTQTQAKSARWSSELSPEQEKKIALILEEAEPRIQTLRQAMQSKMKKLKNFAYASPNDNETLASLGQELQKLRKDLRKELKILDEKLQQEVGVIFQGYRGRDCNDLAKEQYIDEQSIRKHWTATPHHTQ